MSDERLVRQEAESEGAAIRACASQWVIARREHGDWSEESQKALDAWLRQSPAHLVAFLRIDSAWKKANRLAALKPAARTHVWERMRPMMLRFAAALTAIAIVGLVGKSVIPQTSDEKVYSTSSGDRATISLKDGSRIELNVDTTVRLANDGAERRVWLDKGEAYFSVKHDVTRPFVVMVNGHRIVDVGTKFLVRRSDASVRVALMEGSIRFDPREDRAQSGATLKPGDVLVASADKIALTREPVTRLANEISWRNDLVVFEHTTLAEAVAEINRYGRKKLVVADPQTGARKISGAFPASNSELFARVARTALDLKIEERGDTIVISGK
jgi:transmembrane sensor